MRIVEAARRRRSEQEPGFDFSDSEGPGKERSVETAQIQCTGRTFPNPFGPVRLSFPLQASAGTASARASTAARIRSSEHDDPETDS